MCNESTLISGTPVVSYIHNMYMPALLHVKSLISLQIQYHNSSEDEEFYKCVPKKCLPCEYGGDMPSFTVMQSETVQKLRNLKRFLDAEERQWHFMKL